MWKFLKSSMQIGKKIRQLFQGKVDVSQIEKLEQMLYEADLGAQTVDAIIKKIEGDLKHNPQLSSEEVINLIKEEIKKDFQNEVNQELALEAGPKVILVVGVNGNGKTTSCAKLAKIYKDQGKKVLFAAADTFRAAATDQLELWSQKIGIDIVKGKQNSDPSAVVFDAISAAISREKDLLIIDTAGRLHTKTDLMKELEKIRKVTGKALPGAPHETLLVLDATTGQNAIDQAQIFHNYTPLTGLILTKLDGTAKGGAIIAIHKKLKIPIKYVGIGEGMDDFQRFDVQTFIDDLFN